MLLFAAFSAKGQENNNKYKAITIEADTVILDSLSLVWGSVSIENLQPSDYHIDYLKSLLIIDNKDIIGRPLLVKYRTYPYNFAKKTQNKSPSIIEESLYAPVNPFCIIEPTSSIDLLLSDAMLNSYGSISRGISIGNSQDMIVNSNMNLQLSGKLSEDVEILASITDQNIPIQPEGNTAQLQEFDKILIELKYKDIASLRAGDIENQPSGSYFMNYFKKGSGMQADAMFVNVGKKKDSTSIKTALSGSISKGIYRRQSITAVEANQGPYQLQGSNNEIYITVLAGSERIYIDEKLLTRGEDADYTINYNNGEITFTTRCVITKDKRIVAEFEYTQQDYVRSQIGFNTSFEREKLSVRFNFFNEQDHKNQTTNIDLTDQNKQMMSALGNNIDDAYILNIDSTVFQTNEVLYKMIDTTVNGVFYDSIFVYSSNSDSACFRLTFTLLGENKGDYVLSESIVNGRVYAWVAPVGGVPQGNYAPYTLLPTPKRTQMYSLAADYQIHKTTTISIETALSNNDINTFSKIDNQSNVGFALSTSINNEIELKKKNQKSSSWKMNTKGFYELKTANFSYIEDYRSLDFKRNYNTSDSLEENTDHYFGIQLNFKHKTNGNISIGSTGYLIPDEKYQAINNSLQANVNKKGYKASLDATLLNNRQKLFNTNYAKAKTSLSKDSKWLVFGLDNSIEFNRYQLAGQKKVMPQSFAFNELKVYLQNNDSLSKFYRFGIDYTNRIDGTSVDSVLNTSSIGHTINGFFDFLKFSNHQLRFNAAYRYLSYQDSLGENTVLASLDYQGRFFKGAIQLGLYYQAGSGMEQKNEYSYLKVANGQGVYQWIDYNGNGVEELNEFEVAVYKDQANYVRLWMTSNDFIKTFNNQFSTSLILRPATVWRNKSGFKKFLARFSNSTTYRSELKNTLNNLIAALNPFSFNLVDTLLVSANSSLRNTFSFNQTDPIWGLDAIYSHNFNKSVTVNGFESSKYYSWLFSGRVNIFRSFSITSNYSNGWTIRKSEYLNKNYSIYYNAIEGSLSYQYKTSMKISLCYKYSQKANTLGNELSIANKASLEFNYRITKIGNIVLSGNYYHINFRGESNSSVAYEMLESLQPGNNGVVNLSYQTTLWKNLQLNVSYEARASEGVQMKHLASVELRAFF